jgi:rhamnogalacturonyl hydrolase YesR
MALVRVLQFAPGDESHRADYVNDYLLMSRALKDCQRQDGSWNVSLAAPSNYGQAGSEGPEMTGSSLFVGGLAYGVRTGLLDSTTYLPTIRRGWYAMRRALHDDTGFVGYLQGTGACPEDGGVITYNSVPNFEDFGIGCWLWGAAEVYELAQQIETDITLGIDNHVASTPQHVRGNDASAQPYYNLQGLRVLNPQHGHIYIKGGRKILY